MKRILLMDSTSIVELFGNWARENMHTAFWGISKTTDGRQAIKLSGDDAGGYQVILTTEPDSLDIYLVAGYALQGMEAAETRIGSLDDDPGVVLERSKLWILDLAKEYKDLELGNMCVLLATVAKDVALFLDDEKTALVCVDLIAEANDDLNR